MKDMILTKGQVSVVDDEDFERLSQYKWSALKTKGGFYAVRQWRTPGKQNFVYMHRAIMDCPVGMEVDHINHNGLDNRKENLRVCTHETNLQNMKMHKDNTSGIKGVSKHSLGKGWYACIKRGAIRLRKYFRDIKDAEAQYKAWEREFGA